MTYYIMPSNVFIAGALGMGSGSLELETSGSTTDADSDIGFGFNAQVGKQWIVGDNVGVGIAALVQFLTLPPDVGTADNTTALFFGAMFNTSYN